MEKKRQIKVLLTSWAIKYTGDKHEAPAGVIVTGERNSRILFDKEGRMIEESEDCYDQEGDYIDTVVTKYKYDEQGRLISESDGFNETTYVYYEDEEGNSVKETHFVPFEGEEEVSYESKTLDSEGRIIKEYFSRYEMEDECVETEYDDQGRRIRQSFENEKGVAVYEREYQEGVVVEHRTFTPTMGTIEKTTTVTTDSGEDMESVCTRDSDGTVLSRTVVKRVRNCEGKWFPIDVFNYKEEKLVETEHYEYLDPECETFKLTEERPLEGETEISEYKAVYWE